MRLSLIPECGSRDVRALLEVTSVMSPSKILNCSLEIFLEADRIYDVPSVKTKAFLCTVSAVRTDHLAKSCILSGELCIPSVTVEII